MSKKIILISLVAGILLLLLAEKGAGPIVSQNGISTLQLSENIFAKYDINRNEMLEVNEESFLRTLQDSVVKTESRGLLFSDADAAGNQDGLASRTELVNFLMQFDTDHDGEITTYKNFFHSLSGKASEWSKLEELYGERYKYEMKD